MFHVLDFALAVANYSAKFPSALRTAGTTYVSQLKNGHKSPKVDVLFWICPTLGVAASELVAQVERSLVSRGSSAAEHSHRGPRLLNPGPNSAHNPCEAA